MGRTPSSAVRPTCWKRRRGRRLCRPSWSTRACPTRRSPSVPAGSTNDDTPTFTFSVRRGRGAFQCSLEAPRRALHVAVHARDARRGSAPFPVRAIDASGNVDASPATRAFTVDLTPPAAPEVVSGPGGPTTDPRPRSRSPRRTTSSAGSTGRGARAFETCASPKSFSALAPGDYVFTVRSTDAAGNADDDATRVHGHRPQQATPTPTPSPTPRPRRPRRPRDPGRRRARERARSSCA